MKQRVKWLSLLLTFSIVLGSLSTGIFAVDTGSSLGEVSDLLSTGSTATDAVGAEEYVTDSTEQIHNEVIGAVAEITSLRTANTKHFRLSDGTYTAVSYAEPVHRQDANGAWQDIDNTLTLTRASGVQAYGTSDSRVQFAPTFTAGSSLVTLNRAHSLTSLMARRFSSSLTR